MPIGQGKLVDPVEMEVPEIDPKVLGLAVIAQAVEDIEGEYPPMISNRTTCDRVREEAVTFLLTPNTTLAFWCELAELNMEGVNKRAGEILKRKG